MNGGTLDYFMSTCVSRLGYLGWESGAIAFVTYIRLRLLSDVWTCPLDLE